ncbi:MAG: hypothetical protein EOO14_00900 [Chitinophagaceae bacterium]|nr:MAG: hypothetical protein EOO14_00900 [Chitinophagaceae bacterium]
MIVSLPLAYDLLFATAFSKDTYYWVAATLILLRMVDETSKERLTEIRFDTENNQLLFLYKILFFAPRQKALLFEDARLEIVQTKSGWTWLWEPLTLYFLKNKKEMFEIKKSKDGFSVEKLREIIRTVENLSLPITKV